MNEWDSNEKRRRWRGESTEGNRTFRVVGVAAKRVRKEDKMNTAESEAEGCMCSCCLLASSGNRLKTFEDF